jgi:hypothetical protein
MKRVKEFEYSLNMIVIVGQHEGTTRRQGTKTE